MIIFLDESGDSCGFKPGSSKSFNICLVVCQDAKPLKRVLQKLERNLIRDGWPKGKEIKASSLWRCRFDSEVPGSFKFKGDPLPAFTKIYSKLCTCPIEVDYISVKKEKLSDGLKQAPFGILYNYLAGQVLQPRLKGAINLHLNVDAQNKEIHSGKKFDGYIQTRAFELSPSLRHIGIEHLDSSKVYGLRAVDFFSWAVFRCFEFNDDRFIKMIRSVVNSNNAQEWFHK